jgi:two-component sensor histidine kinase
MKPRNIIIIFCLLLNINSLYASLDITKNLNCTNSYYFDTNNTSKIEEISQKTFQKMDKNSFSFGTKRGDLWLKIACTNKDTNINNLILTINESFYETANLFTYVDNKFEKHSNGLLYPISKREVESKLLSFHINIPHGQSKVYYLQLNAKYNYIGKIKIFENDKFFLHEMMHSNILYMLAFGIFIIIISTNMFLYLAIKEKIYLYYSLYIFCTLVYLIIASGMLAYLDLQKYIYDLYAFAPLAMATFILFTKEALDTKKYFIFFDKYAKFLYIPFLLLAILVFFQYNPWNNIISIYTLFVNMLLLFVSFFVARKSQKKSITLYSVGLIFYFLNFIFAILFGLGILEYNIYTRNSMLIGILLEAIFFQILIVKKYQDIKQNELILKNEIINIEINKNIELESKVDQRTKELKNMLTEREVLLKEVHHRVKNNFHSLIGVLWMDDEKNNTNKNVELINHLKALSKIHENLSSFDNINFIQLEEYIIEIIMNLKIASTTDFSIQINIENITIPFESAMSLGVIVNELITNATKHSDKNSSLNLWLKVFAQETYVIVEFLDNNKECADIEKSGVGISIIKHFSSILHNSSHSFNYDHGNKFTLKFEEKREICQ